MEFIGIIERLNELAAECASLNEEGKKTGWAPKAYAAWYTATTTYNATKEALELLGFEVDRTPNGDGTYTHSVTKGEAQ